MPEPLHYWESVGDDLANWMSRAQQQLDDDLIGGRRPWQPSLTREQQMDWHLEHLYPPQMGGQLDQAYLAHMITTSTEEEIRGLGPALQRFMDNKSKEAGLPPPGEAGDRQYGGALPPAPPTYQR